MTILMSDGSRVLIKDVREGQKVRTRHEHTMEWGDHEISMVFKSMSERMSVTIGGTEFICPPNHKFYDNGIWMEAGCLREGMRIDGLKVSKVAGHEYGEVVRVWVKDAQTYLCEGFLCHS